MIHLREHWEGFCLSQDYTLEQCLGGDDRAALFQTSPGPDGRRAVVKLVPESVVDGPATLDLWHRTRQLRHPNLVELLDCGRAEHGGETVCYAVFEAPDDTLASALSRSPLDREEAREALDSILEALRYLHAQGLVHGALDPDHIVAVGDRIKLSTDGLRDAAASAAYRKDVRLLGHLWQHALMPASSKSSEIAAHAADPNPQTRWTLAEINAALNAALPAVPPPAELLTVSTPVSAPPIPVAPVSVAPVAVRDSPPDPAPSHPPTPKPALVHRFPKWIFVGAAGVLLLIVGLNLPRSAGVASQSRVASVSLPAETPAPAPLPNAAVPEVAVPAVPKPSPDSGKEMWRVIAFTYRSRSAAEKRVELLQQHHPELNATVFSPNDKKGYHLVSLGGLLTLEKTLRLQRRAQGKGLPRDLYVQNYSE
jgi:hypothetical protein